MVTEGSSCMNQRRAEDVRTVYVDGATDGTRSHSYVPQEVPSVGSAGLVGERVAVYPSAIAPVSRISTRRPAATQLAPRETSSDVDLPMGKDSGKVAATVDTPMVDHLRALAVFTSVVNTGSFRAAAKELHLAPSVVSHHVSSLERRLRIILLHRSTRRLSLTSDGKRLFDVTHAMLKSAETAFHEIARSAEDPSGTIRVCAPAVAASGPLMEHLASFMQLYPRVHLAIHLLEGAAQEAAEDFDLVLRVCWPHQVTKRMKKVHAVPGRLVASPAYLALRSLPTHPSELAAWDWIRFQPHPADMEVRHPEQGVVRVRGIERARVDSMAAVHKLAVHGIGVARLPAFLADPTLHAGQLVEILPEWRLVSPDIYAVLPPQVPKSGILWKLYQYLLAQTAESPS